MLFENEGVSRRALLRTSGVAAISGAVGALVGGCSRSQAAVAGEPPAPIKLPSLLAPTESETKQAEAPLPPEKRLGIAVVGLGRLALEQILPAFAETKLCRPVALVSGHREKAEQVANHYGIASKNIYDYAGFDQLRNNDQIGGVYIVLPNGMHAEYSERASKAGKHVLCEKPMAVSVAECQRMIDAAKAANKKLMVAYRLQYEPHHRKLIALARSGELGKLKGLLASNGQNQGDPQQWRLKRALAGGGALPDVGVYCVNAARYLTGEEPVLVSALTHSTPNDPRFAEVEEQIELTLQFPSGFMATCSAAYGMHNTKLMRLHAERGWAEMSPAFPYQGLALKVSAKSKDSDEEVTQDLKIPSKNHFALEMDHFARCVMSGATPHTPGEEGLQDVRIIEALYESANARHPVQLPAVPGTDPFRGPPPS
jgi:predicted dehydrogenase